jgi:hypothetical protein
MKCEVIECLVRLTPVGAMTLKSPLSANNNSNLIINSFEDERIYSIILEDNTSFISKFSYFYLINI